MTLSELLEAVLSAREELKKAEAEYSGCEYHRSDALYKERQALQDAKAEMDIFVNNFLKNPRT